MLTLEQLDRILYDFGLDINHNPLDLYARNKILYLHGKSILDSKKTRCSNCWHKDHGKCGKWCSIYTSSDDPIEVSKEHLGKDNNISIFPFLCKYMIPVYEETTGNKDTMREIAKAFRRQWIKEKGGAENMPVF